MYRGQGRLDLSLVRSGATSAYFVFPLVKNNLPGSAASGPDANEIDCQSFAVDISAYQRGTPPAGCRLCSTRWTRRRHRGLLAAPLQPPWAVTIASGGGMAATFVGAFPVDLAARVLATAEVGVSPSSMLVNLRIRAFGTHQRRKTIESDPFDFPLHVCNGCLVANVAPCPYTAAPANTGNECNVAQDNYGRLLQLERRAHLSAAGERSVKRRAHAALACAAPPPR